MKWKDIADLEDCDLCPLKKEEICSGGWRCYGGAPIEPPCCSFDDDTDLEEWINDYYARRRRWEQAEDERLKKEKAKKEKAEKAAETRRQMKFYCRNEIQELKRLENQLKADEASLRLASSFAEAFNVTNEMFGYPDGLKQKPEAQKTIDLLQEQIKQAKEKYEQKRKEFYRKRKEDTDVH